LLDLSIVEELVNEFLKDHNELSLYSLEWANEFGYKILRVAIDKKGGINSDELAVVNDYLSEQLDKYENDLPANYMLEVCSPGAEKPLRNEEEVLNSIGEKINAKTDKFEFEGKLLSFEGRILTIQINVKGRIKKVEVPYDDIKEIRLAV